MVTWNKITKSEGISWNKISFPNLTKGKDTYLLLETGDKLLQENNGKIVLDSILLNIWNNITKSAGIIWNKIK